MLKFGNPRSYLRATTALPFAMAALAAENVSPSLAAPPYSVLYRFQGAIDGDTPNGNLVVGSSGNILCTTKAGR